MGLLTPLRRLYPLPVRQASTLPAASFRFRLATDTLAVRLTLPLAGRVKDFHLQVIPPATTAVQTAPVTALRAMPGAPNKKAGLLESVDNQSSVKMTLVLCNEFIVRIQ